MGWDLTKLSSTTGIIGSSSCGRCVADAGRYSGEHLCPGRRGFNKLRTLDAVWICTGQERPLTPRTLLLLAWWRSPTADPFKQQGCGRPQRSWKLATMRHLT
eukprot:366026-Chlamydomonas_euryale.AAC.8